MREAMINEAHDVSIHEIVHEAQELVAKLLCAGLVVLRGREPGVAEVVLEVEKPRNSHMTAKSTNG